MTVIEAGTEVEYTVTYLEMTDVAQLRPRACEDPRFRILEATVKQWRVNRFLYEEEATGRDEDVIAIYGTPFGEPEAVLFVDESAILRPPEKAPT